MKLDKRMRIIALFSLVALLLAFNVSAVGLGTAVQEFVSSGKILMNFVIVLAALFVAQIFMIHPFIKESKIQQRIVFVLIILISIFAAWKIGDNSLFEFTNLGLLMNFKVIINALLTTLLFIIAEHYLKLGEGVASVSFGGSSGFNIGKGKTRIFIYILLLFISATIAVHLASDNFHGGMYRDKFLWEMPGTGVVKNYFWGDGQSCSPPGKIGDWSYQSNYGYMTEEGGVSVCKFGILRGQHMFVLIGAILLLSWGLGTAKLDKRFKYIVAVLVAANIANHGMGKQEFLEIAYWLILIILYRSFSASMNGKKGWAAGLSFGIVNSIGVTFGVYYGPTTFESSLVAGAIIGYLGTFAFGENGVVSGALGGIKDGLRDKMTDYAKKNPWKALGIGLGIGGAITGGMLGGLGYLITAVGAGASLWLIKDFIKDWKVIKQKAGVLKKRIDALILLRDQKIEAGEILIVNGINSMMPTADIMKLRKRINNVSKILNEQIKRLGGQP